jgi:hypothetical protein
MRPRVLLFPGATLMELTPTAGGLRVRCPGCRATRVVHDDETDVTFKHEEHCPVYHRIEAATRRYAQKVKRG